VIETFRTGRDTGDRVRHKQVELLRGVAIDGAAAKACR
jgi:hypothetical protein